MSVARVGVPINRIGRAVEQTVVAQGYAVCTELMGPRHRTSHP
jgi:methionine aminopeptidase